MTQQRINIGKHGEDLARSYLERHNYTILQRNFRCKLGEIDIVAQDRGMVVFVEVRTQTSNAYGPAYNTVTFSKQKQVKRVALYYISKYNLVNTQIRFDVIGITLNPDAEEYQLDHIQNAF